MDPDEYDRWATARDAAVAEQGRDEIAPAPASRSDLTRAPLRWPASRRRRPPPSPPAASSSDSDSNSNLSSDSSEGDNCPPRAKRVRIESSTTSTNDPAPRAAAPAPSSPGVERADTSGTEERAAAAAEAVVEAQKAVRRAERQLTSAKLNLKAKQKQESRAFNRFRKCLDRKKKGPKLMQQCLLWQNMHRKSERAEHVAQLGQRDALISYLEAQLELRVELPCSKR